MGRGRTTAILTNRVSSLLQVRSDEEYFQHFANVLSRWSNEFTNEIGVLEGTTKNANTQAKDTLFAKKIDFIYLRKILIINY